MALALVRDGKLLVVKRAHEPKKGKFELAGGFIDFGESAYDTAIRESREELGIIVEQSDLFLVDVYYNGYNPFVWSIDVTFLVTKWLGDPTPNDDVADFMWQPYDFIYNPQFCQKHYIGLDTAIEAKLNTKTVA